MILFAEAALYHSGCLCESRLFVGAVADDLDLVAALDAGSDDIHEALGVDVRTVDPEGNVIDTRINNRTNTTNLQLRNAAEQAARKTKFNAIGGENNQTGTITYYFKLK